MYELFPNTKMVRMPGSDCKGCGKCCRGMGDTIVLDPWDADQLCKGLGKSFAQLLEQEVDLHVEERLIIPHLRMREETDACTFLDEDGKCQIHSFRPGICRLYPLGRQYREQGVRYFYAPDTCLKDGVGTVKTQIDKWLDIPGGGSGLRHYEKFKADWQQFTRMMKGVLADKDMQQEIAQQINVYLMQQFFWQAYPEGQFYEAFEERLERVRSLFAE